ncbi:hypothetical protein BH11PSE8_BH11PSE8_22830 [soil metagenome]
MIQTLLQDKLLVLAIGGLLIMALLGMGLLYLNTRRRARHTARLRDQFMHLIERSHQGVAVMQGETMRYANPALRRMYGLPEEGAPQPPGGTFRDATMPEAERAAARVRHRQIVTGVLPQAHWEGQRLAFDGRTLHLRFSAWQVDWDGESAEQVVITDDTARVETIRSLLHQALHDELTGLPNRSALIQRLRELCSAEPPVPFALVLLDVDRFKLFNEAHGPSIGDAVLRALALALQHTLAGRADVMRLGEDEFALLAELPVRDEVDATRPHAGEAATGAATETAARALAARVREMLAQPLSLPEHGFFLDVSMGIALHPANGREPEALLRAANAAMHEAKHTPGTSLQLAEERFERGSGATLAAEQALRAGMRQQEFALVYQPKVDGRSGALLGFEALVRWDRPGIGRVSPLEFIPAAERTGLIVPLGQTILTQACRQIARWRREFGTMVPVAVNVSPLQLLDAAFPELVVSILAEFDVPPALLTLEITESAAVTHMDQANEQLTQLRLHGILVALDDFGTGFSSLNMLRGLPLRTVKIDRSLIDPLPDVDAGAVVKAICDLAGVLRLEVVAEGVETEAQAAAALAAGCHVMQGFLYAKPLAPDDAAEWLRRLN